MEGNALTQCRPIVQRMFLRSAFFTFALYNNWNLLFFRKQKLLNNRTHVSRHLAEKIRYVEMLMDLVFVLVLLDLSEVHQHAGPNVLSIQTVYLRNLVSIKNVLILVLEAVRQMVYVE